MQRQSHQKLQHRSSAVKRFLEHDVVRVKRSDERILRATHVQTLSFTQVLVPPSQASWQQELLQEPCGYTSMPS